MKGLAGWLAGMPVLVLAGCLGTSAPPDASGPNPDAPAEDRSADAPDPGVDGPAEGDSRDAPGEALAELPGDTDLPGADDGPSCGCANLDLLYQGVLPESAIVDVVVRVLPGGYPCSLLKQGASFPTGAVLAEAALADLQATATFDCLPPGATYTLHAEGHRLGSPCVVVAGCTEGVYLPPDACVERTLTLYPLQLDLPGRYDCIDHFDFCDVVRQCAGGDTTNVSCDTDAADLGQAVCCALSGTVRFFADPGLVLIDTLQTLAAEWVGTLLSNATIGPFKDAIARVVTTWILESSPPYVREFVGMGRDFIAAISSIEMQSELVLRKAAGHTLDGSRYWHRLTLYWRHGCNPASPGHATCGVVALDLEALDDPLFPRAMLGGTFGSDIADIDQLTILRHTVNLNYGRLVRYVLDAVVIPGFTAGKAHGLNEAAHLWLDCAAIAAGILGEVGTSFGGTQADIEDLCNRGVDAVVGPAAGWIDRLAQFPESTMSIQGQARLVDVPDAAGHCDLQVDSIIGGVTTGSLQGASPRAAIAGDFGCIRR